MSERRAEDGWIAWSGGKRPIDTDTRVEVSLRNGLSNEGRAYQFEWRHGHGAFSYECDDDIIAYRVVSA